MQHKDSTVLSVQNLHVQIGKRMILQDVSFNVRASEIVGVIGPNGCGKTTLLNTVSGFLPVDAGTIAVNGKDIMNTPAHERARLGIVRGFQHAGVFREMTIEENLMTVIEQAEQYPWWWMFSHERRKKMDHAITHALDEVNLAEHRKSLAGVLSGGQLRLLELARLKLARGNLFLIDEPTAGVAPAFRNVLSAAIERLSKEHGHTIVLVEHDLPFLFGLAERIIVLVDGQKYLEGKPEDIRKDERLRKVYFGD